MNGAARLPLFPLNTVLFPAGPLPLRIFEQRYLGMVSRSLKEDSGFGVCLISEGDETGKAKFHIVGTLARICDWGKGEDGLLNVLCVGERRFRITRSRAQDDGLNIGTVEWLPEEPLTALPGEYDMLRQWLQRVWKQLPAYYARFETHFDDAAWVGHRLAEILPLNMPQKQYLLELDQPVERLQVLLPLVQSLGKK